ncbi:unnamed protein product [Ambrosiozyma monospora]|uniref:Unnamed protein product n=1 Tax=Ambrosiozyma monospora TaxID=43982 RepID=A0ACB5TPZ8_AMBMO|nr:unnamed protein product [Ambrosiozyma monospora]
MRLLPHASRPLISKMLTIDPAKRASMKEILSDEWFQEIKYCTVVDDKDAPGGKRVVLDPGHGHTVDV